MRAMLLIGSKMPVAYCTNAASVPTETSCGTWNTSCPPFQSTSAVATAPRLVTIGMNSALSTAARTEAERMIRVSCANSSQFARSRLRVLVVLAPMMPSLNAPVMREFVLRTVR